MYQLRVLGSKCEGLGDWAGSSRTETGLTVLVGILILLFRTLTHRFKNVIREDHNRMTKLHGAFARVLSFLLLGFIVYGTTVEAAHTHGNLPGANNTARVVSLSDPATGSDSNSNLQGCGDCLICQLHQNFSATLVPLPPSLAPLPVRSSFFNLAAVSVFSETNAPRRGRAPPFSL
jgi:hypothetical protein